MNVTCSNLMKMYNIQVACIITHAKHWHKNRVKNQVILVKNWSYNSQSMLCIKHVGCLDMSEVGVGLQTLLTDYHL